MIDAGNRGDRLERPVERRPGTPRWSRRHRSGMLRFSPAPSPSPVSSARPRKYGYARSGSRVDRHVADVAAAPEDLLAAVAVVVVDVEDRDPLAGRPDDRLGGDRGVVEEAVAAVHRAGGVMPGRPAQAVGRDRATEDEVHRGQGHVDGGPGGRIGPGDERRRRVEPPEAGAAGRVHRLSRERSPPRPRTCPRTCARSGTCRRTGTPAADPVPVPRTTRPRGSGRARARGWP